MSLIENGLLPAPSHLPYFPDVDAAKLEPENVSEQKLVQVGLSRCFSSVRGELV